MPTFNARRRGRTAASTSDAGFTIPRAGPRRGRSLGMPLTGKRGTRQCSPSSPRQPTRPLRRRWCGSTAIWPSRRPAIWWRRWSCRPPARRRAWPHAAAGGAFGGPMTSDSADRPASSTPAPTYEYAALAWSPDGELACLHRHGPAPALTATSDCDREGWPGPARSRRHRRPGGRHANAGRRMARRHRPLLATPAPQADRGGGGRRAAGGRDRRGQ